MPNSQNLPFHHYSETQKYVNILDGHPALTVDPEFPFVLTEFSLMHNRAQTELPHRHDYFEILFIEECEGQHIVDYEAYDVKPPVVYFLSKGQIHFWKLTKPLKGKVILFPREFLISPASNAKTEGDLLTFDSLSKAPALSIDAQDLPRIKEIVDNIQEEYSREDHSLSMIRAYTHILLVHLMRIYADEHFEDILDAPNTMVRQFRQLVSENYLEIRSVQEYADMVGISATHLRDTVKEVTGYSPGQLIRQEIIFEAKRQLANTELTTAEIAYALNFEDTSYFSRYFKRETGKSPSVYREEIREKYQIKS